MNWLLREAFAISKAICLTFLFMITISVSFLPNAFLLGKIFLRCEQNISTTIHAQHEFAHLFSAHGILPFEMEIALSIISTCFFQKQY